MKIIHITDLHFGPYQWAGNNVLLLDRLNEFEADLVFNTGDMDLLPRPRGTRIWK